MAEQGVYRVASAVGGGLIVMARGYEFATADDAAEAARICADDAILGYPEAAPDILDAVATRLGGRLSDVVHTGRFRDALSEIIGRDLRDDLEREANCVPSVRR